MPKPPEIVDVDFVAPRHLAGGGDPSWVTVPLHRACGWSYGHDPLMPRVILSSPDQRALLRLEPDPDGQWWTLHHAQQPDRPAWYASFGARTPVEIIAAFTDTLTSPAADPADDWDPLEPLQKSGWSPAYSHNHLASADGTIRVEVNETTGCWWVGAALDRTGPPLWQARFGEHTPPHLITAFTAALTDPSPVLRTATVVNLPTRDPDLITVTRREVPAAQVASALEERVHALAARRASTPANPSPLRRSPAKNTRSR